MGARSSSLGSSCLGRGLTAVVGAVLTAGLVLAAGSGASAQALTGDEEAQMHFQMGRRYYENGRFQESAQEFERAYALAPMPELLYNLYLAYRDLGDDPHAADALRRYVAALPEGGDRTLLEARLSTLEARVAAASEAVEADVAPEGEGEVDEGSADTAAPAASGGGLGAASWVVGGIGAALLLASLGTGVAALDERSALVSMCPMGACPAGLEPARERGQALAIATDVLWVTGAATLATGIVLLVVDATSSSPPDATPALACTPDGCTAFVMGSL